MTRTASVDLENTLRRRREELVTRLARISGELDRPLPADAEDQAIELEDDEVLEDLGHAGERELRAIDAALVRIEDGSYGLCRECGEAISPVRLEALPTAALCRSCAH